MPILDQPIKILHILSLEYCGHFLLFMAFTIICRCETNTILRNNSKLLQEGTSELKYTY